MILIKYFLDQNTVLLPASLKPCVATFIAEDMVIKGPKPDWVKNFFAYGNEFLADNTLGPMQISMFKRFLSDSGLIEKAKTTSFFEVIKKIGAQSEAAWGLILIQLAYTKSSNQVVH